MTVTADDIRKTAAMLNGQIIRTPILEAPMLSRQFGCDLFLKLECLQHTSSFKARGALNAMIGLSAEQRKKGVIAMSAGNHAQAVAYHAERMGIPATIVMPAQTPFAKMKTLRASVFVQGIYYQISSATRFCIFSRRTGHCSRGEQLISDSPTV